MEFLHVVQGAAHKDGLDSASRPTSFPSFRARSSPIMLDIISLHSKPLHIPVAHATLEKQRNPSFLSPGV